jgi:hypothetical protein
MNCELSFVTWLGARVVCKSAATVSLDMAAATESQDWVRTPILHRKMLDDAQEWLPNSNLELLRYAHKIISVLHSVKD